MVLVQCVGSSYNMLQILVSCYIYIYIYIPSSMTVVHSYSSSQGIDPLGDTDPFGNYVSFTIWSEKKPFKHGVLKEDLRGTQGCAKTSVHDGLLIVTSEYCAGDCTRDCGWMAQCECGWCFVACNQFFVPFDNPSEFESRWKDCTTKLKEFISFDLIPHVQAKGYGIVSMGDEEPSYMTCTIWKDRYIRWFENGNCIQGGAQAEQW